MVDKGNSADFYNLSTKGRDHRRFPARRACGPDYWALCCQTPFITSAQLGMSEATMKRPSTLQEDQGLQAAAHDSVSMRCAAAQGNQSLACSCCCVVTDSVIQPLSSGMASDFWMGPTLCCVPREAETSCMAGFLQAALE